MYFMLLVYMPILYQIFEIYQIIPQSTVVEGVIDKNIPSVRHYSPNWQQLAIGILKPVKLSWPNLNNKVFVS